MYRDSLDYSWLIGPRLRTLLSVFHIFQCLNGSGNATFVVLIQYTDVNQNSLLCYPTARCHQSGSKARAMTTFVSVLLLMGTTTVNEVLPLQAVMSKGRITQTELL